MVDSWVILLGICQPGVVPPSSVCTANGPGSWVFKIQIWQTPIVSRWKFWYGLLQKEFLANFKRLCFICLISYYMANLWIFCWCFKHVLKAKLFANLANSAEVVPLKTYRGHIVAPRIVTSWPTRHFRRDFIGINNGSDCIKPHPEISHTYPSIYSDSDVRCTSCTFQSLSLISGFCFGEIWWFFLDFTGFDHGFKASVQTGSGEEDEGAPRATFWDLDICQSMPPLKAFPLNSVAFPRKPCLHPSNKGTHATSAWTKSGSQKPFAAHLFLNIRLKGERRFCASRPGYVLMGNPCNIDGTIGVAI